ncbi:MAG TPA: hypothetical protein VJ748_01335, partial [Vitreimonas sp.]|nr:hypothetical protein [Vitreimonas sp.]
MSNGYLVAAAADLSAAHEIGDGFGLDVIDASSVHDQRATSAALAGAANVGLLLSNEAARDEAFVALLGSLATQLERAQLILATPDARDAFTFLPAAWPAMSLDEARSRAQELQRQRQAEAAPLEDTPRAAPLPAEGAEPAPEPQEAVPPALDEAPAPEGEHVGGEESGADEHAAPPEESAQTDTF